MPRPPRPWFRFYSETLESHKAFVLGTERPDLYFRWTWLLALANISEPRGSLPQDSVKIAYALRVTTNEVAEILSELKARHFIDLRGKRLFMHNWSAWNPDSDANLTPGRASKNEVTRVRTRKERVKNAESPPLERVKNAVARRREEEEIRGRDQRTDVEEDGDRAPVPLQQRRNIFKLYEDAFGHGFAALERERMIEMETEFPEDCIEHAFRESAELNKRSLRYVDSICKKHQEQGTCYAERPGRNGSGIHAAEPVVTTVNWGVRYEPAPRVELTEEERQRVLDDLARAEAEADAVVQARGKAASASGQPS